MDQYESRRNLMMGVPTSGLAMRSQIATLMIVLLSVAPYTTTASDDLQGTVIAVGGGKIPDSIWNRFVELAGCPDGRLVVIPTATADENLPTEADLLARWKERGIGAVTLLHTRDADVANDPDFAEPIRKATAVWISGGDQSRLSKAYAGTNVERELTKLLSRGGVIGGTSAGAAIQSQVMIAGGKLVPVIGRGFDLVPNTIIDQHVLRRHRINRLMHAVRAHPNRVGLGIDESTALVVRGSKVRVIGASCVFAVTAADGDRPLQILTFRDGDRFDLRTVLE